MAKSILTRKIWPLITALKVAKSSLTLLMVSKNLIGRAKEKKLLTQLIKSDESEFIAVYGRRRVGKTFLITEHLKEQGLFFHVTGVKGASLSTQLSLFVKELSRVFYNELPLTSPPNWLEAFELLTKAVTSYKGKRPVIVFLDELPWLASPRSKLIESLDYYWNTKWSKIPFLKLIVCGSAASWMLENLINAKGGLHNRLTRHLLVKPFSLKETKELLSSRGIKLTHKQVLDLFMTMGGIPYYLKQVESGLSAIQNIDQLCFQTDGILYNEYPRLLQSLFDHSELHDKILRCLGNAQQGLSRSEITKRISGSSGGRLSEKLEELKEAGFIKGYVPYGNQKKSTFYRITDEYVWFYLNWIQHATVSTSTSGTRSYWQKRAQTPAFRSWSGYAFESVCLKHEELIAKALSLQSTHYEIGGWRFVPTKGGRAQGAQIDLLFDRGDDAITLCEIKYNTTEFSIDRSYADQLKKKIEIFAERTKTRKQLFLVLITSFGLKKNIWSEGLIDSVVTLDDLFAD